MVRSPRYGWFTPALHMDALWRDKSKSEQPPSGTFVRRFPSMANNAALRPSWIRLQENPGWAAARQNFHGAPAKKIAASQVGSPNRDRVTTLATNKKCRPGEKANGGEWELRLSARPDCSGLAAK